jgi:hypothetical protein
MTYPYYVRRCRSALPQHQPRHVVDVLSKNPKKHHKPQRSVLYAKETIAMPSRFAYSHQQETRFQASASDAHRFLAPSFALFSISESSEAKDLTLRSAWGSACSRKSCRSNLSSLGNQSSLDQLYANSTDQHQVSSMNKAGMNRPQSPTTSIDDGSWGFYEESDGYIH